MTKPNPAHFAEAAHRIRTGGLTKGHYNDERGFCTLGALRYPEREGALDLEAEVALLAELIGDRPSCLCGCGTELAGFSAIAAWNDHPDRTPDDVVTLLEQAKEKAEADR